MTHWSDSPQRLQQLAAAYVLGTLSGPARRRFEALRASHPPAARAVDEWVRRLAPLGGRLAPVPASPALWERIASQAFGAEAASASAAPAPAPAPLASAPALQTPAAAPARAAPTPRRADTPRWRRWLDALLAPAPAFALAAGLFAGLLLPGLLPMLGDPEARTELPESYVGVLATTDGRPGLIVSSRRLGRVVDVKRVAEQPVPPGLTLYLWTIDAQGRPAPVAPLAAGPFVRLTIPQPAEAVFAQAVELGVTAEPLGQAPAQPSGAWLYRGLCGKLWRVPAPR